MNSTLPNDMSRTSRGRPRVTVIYDGDCGFCRKMLRLVIRFLRPALTNPPRTAEGSDRAVLRQQNSWIVRDARGTEFYRFDALIAVIRSSWLFPVAPLLKRWPLRAAGTASYKFVAKRRSFFSKLVAWIK